MLFPLVDIGPARIRGFAGQPPVDAWRKAVGQGFPQQTTATGSRALWQRTGLSGKCPYPIPAAMPISLSALPYIPDHSVRGHWGVLKAPLSREPLIQINMRPLRHD
jgi:hypothetical protein